MARNAPEATEDEVMALFDKDGDLREQTSDEPEEATEEEAQEDEPEAEADEAEDSEDEEEEEPQGDEDSEIDWDEVDPKVKQAYEKIQSEAQKWQKDYGKLQSKWTKESQSKKEFESDLPRLKQRDELLSRYEELLENNPKIVEFIKKEQSRKTNPFEDEDVPEYLKQDPAYQYMQSKFVPYVKSLEEKLSQTEKRTSKITEWEAKEVESANKAKLDVQLDAAKQKISSMFGRDATEDEVTEVLQFMVDNQFYGNGAAAAAAALSDKHAKVVQATHQQRVKEKAKKFPARTKTVSGRAAPKDASSAEEAIFKALAEQGY